MRTILLAALAASASACCVDVARDDACVVTRAPSAPYCFTLDEQVFACTSDVGPIETQDPRSCPGTIYEDQDCGARGFTVRCWDDHYARPGDPC